MTNLNLIQTQLPENLWEIAQNFNIDDNSLSKYANLIVLILNSKSLADNAEKQNRFNLLTIMNEEQISKLEEILTREKEKLEEINQKYAQKQQEINAKYQQMFDPQAYQKTQSQLQAKENINRQQELEEADNLLAQM